MKWYFVLNDGAHPSYIEVAKVAVASCQRNTTLEPHCLWDGPDTPFVEWLRARGVVVHKTMVPFLDVLEANRGVRGLNPATARGAYLRIMIPVIERENDYVLYTDCDVVFQSDPTPILTGIRPTFLAATAESDVTRKYFFNSGVMLINVQRLRAEHEGFVRFIADNIPNWMSFSPNDQGAYNYFFRGCWSDLPPFLNWKPYWRVDTAAIILHYHGMRPQEILSHLAGGRIANSNLLTGKSEDHIKFHCLTYFEYLPSVYANLSTLTKLTFDNTNIYAEMLLGDEIAAYDEFGLEIEINGIPSGCYLWRVPRQPAEQVSKLVIPRTVAEAELSTKVRARLLHRPHEWAVATEARPERLVDAGGRLSVIGTDALGRGRLSSGRVRIHHQDVESAKPFYIVLLASSSITLVEDDLRTEPIAMSAFRPLVITRRSLDRAEGAFVHLPEGVVAFSDYTAEFSDLRDRTRHPADAASFARAGRIESSSVLLSGPPDGDGSIEEEINLLMLLDDEEVGIWLPDLLSQLAQFESHPNTRRLRYLIPKPTTGHREALDLLGVGQDRLYPNSFDGWISTATLHLLIRRGPDLSIFRQDREGWAETTLGRRFGAPAAGKRVLLCTKKMLSDDWKAQIADCLIERGWTSLFADETSPTTLLRTLRSAQLITVLGADVGGLICFANAVAAVQDIQFGPQVEASLAYKAAMAKSLSYAPVVLSGLDHSPPANLRRLTDLLEIAAKQMLSTNVMTFRMDTQAIS